MLFAKDQEPEVQAISTEQEQQFTYYWYAAKQAIVESRYADAYLLLEFCHAINPNDGTTSSFLGRIYDAIENHFAALQLYREAFIADPYDNWQLYYQTLRELKLPFLKKETLKVLERAYDVQSAAAKKKGKNGKVDETLLDELLLAYAQKSDWRKALKIQDKIDRQKGFDETSALMRYKIYVNWNKPRKAIEVIDRYLELNPTDVRFMLLRIDIMDETNAKASEFYAIFNRILEIQPNNLMVLNNYAYYLATNHGDLQEAERMSAITISEDPNEPVYLDTYGWILHLKGEDNLALVYLNRALWRCSDEKTKAVIEAHIKKITGGK